MPKINPHIFRAYDIRGIADNSGLQTVANGFPKKDPPEVDLTEEAAYLIGKGTATYLIRKYNCKHMAVGRDVRLTSPKLQKSFIKGLLECGLNVTDIGLSPSPMIYFATCAKSNPFFKTKFDCGTNITASHNPKEYNGIKTVADNAHSICGDELQEIKQLIEKEDFEKHKTTGTLETFDVWPIYLEELASKLHSPNKKLIRPLKIVVDAGNGAAGPFIPELLKKIMPEGGEIIPLYCEPDGTFPNHEANPEELHNMTALIKKVLETKADLGIGFDGDGDRIGIVDEKGNLYSSDFLLLLLTKDLLSRTNPIPDKNLTSSQNSTNPIKNTRPKIVFDVKVSQAIINKMAELGAEPIMSKTGHSFIEKRMKEENALLAGEVSGHLFFAEDYYGFDDAFLAAIKILEILANGTANPGMQSPQPGTTINNEIPSTQPGITTNPGVPSVQQKTHTNPKTFLPFSQLFSDLPKTYMTPEFKAKCPDDKKFQIVQSLVDHFTKLYDCITIDGVRIEFDEISWGAVRASNTSPNLTLRFEADTEEKLQKIQKIMVDELKKYPEVDLSWYK